MFGDKLRLVSMKKETGLIVAVIAIFFFLFCLVISGLGFFLFSKRQSVGEFDVKEAEIGINTNSDENEEAVSSPEHKVISTEKIAYLQDVDFPNGGDLWIMNFDGSEKEQLTTGNVVTNLIGWSSDNKYIVVETSEVTADHVYSKMEVFELESNSFVTSKEIDTYDSVIRDWNEVFVPMPSQGSDDVERIDVYTLPDLEFDRTISLENTSISLGYNGMPLISDDNRYLFGVSAPEWSEPFVYDLQENVEYTFKSFAEVDTFMSYISTFDTYIVYQGFIDLWVYDWESDTSTKIMDFPTEPPYEYSYVMGLERDGVYYFSVTTTLSNSSAPTNDIYSYDTVSGQLTHRKDVQAYMSDDIVASPYPLSVDPGSWYIYFGGANDAIYRMDIKMQTIETILDSGCYTFIMANPS